MEYQFRVLTNWPGVKKTIHKSSPFSARWDDTLSLLERELEFLRAKNVVLQAAVKESEIRNDGMLRAGARPSWPGIVLSFSSKHGDLMYPCDTYHDWQANLRAIALSLAALRSVDRYGVTKKAEQYQGWAKLPGPTAHSPMDLRSAALLLLDVAEADQHILTRENYREIVRRAQLKTHPDHGGSPERFKRVTEAQEIVELHFKR